MKLSDMHCEIPKGTWIHEKKYDYVYQADQNGPAADFNNGLDYTLATCAQIAEAGGGLPEVGSYVITCNGAYPDGVVYRVDEIDSIYQSVLGKIKGKRDGWLKQYVRPCLPHECPVEETPEPRYKVGDRVRIVSNISAPHLEIGEIATITKIKNSNWIIVENNKRIQQVMKFADLEPLPPEPELDAAVTTELPEDIDLSRVVNVAELDGGANRIKLSWSKPFRYGNEDDPTDDPLDTRIAEVVKPVVAYKTWSVIGMDGMPVVRKTRVVESVPYTNDNPEIERWYSRGYKPEEFDELDSWIRRSFGRE